MSGRKDRERRGVLFGGWRTHTTSLSHAISSVACYLVCHYYSSCLVPQFNVHNHISTLLPFLLVPSASLVHLSCRWRRHPCVDRGGGGGPAIDPWFYIIILYLFLQKSRSSLHRTMVFEGQDKWRKWASFPPPIPPLLSLIKSHFIAGILCSTRVLCGRWSQVHLIFSPSPSLLPLWLLSLSVWMHHCFIVFNQDSVMPLSFLARFICTTRWNRFF